MLYLINNNDNNSYATITIITINIAVDNKISKNVKQRGIVAGKKIVNKNRAKKKKAAEIYLYGNDTKNIEYLACICLAPTIQISHDYLLFGPRYTTINTDQPFTFIAVHLRHFVYTKRVLNSHCALL